MTLLTSSIYKHMKELLLRDKAKIALFKKLSNFYFDLRHPGRHPGKTEERKPNPRATRMCESPRVAREGWSGLELTDT